MPSTARDCLWQALSGAMLRRSIGVTVLVGTLLNLINQGDAWWTGAPVHWPKLALTYCVPFCVATYGAWSALVASAREGRRDT